MYQFMNDFDRGFGFPDFARLFRQLNDVAEAVEQDLWTGSKARGEYWVSETEDEYTLRAELPGVKDDDVQVTLRDGVLTIQGHREVKAPGGYQATRRERADFDFSRSFRLPERVDPKRTEARLSNGVLTVTLTKQEKAKPRQISVKTS